MSTKQNLMYDPDKLPERTGKLIYFYPQLVYIGTGNSYNPFPTTCKVWGLAIKIVDVLSYNTTNIFNVIKQDWWKELKGGAEDCYYFVPQDAPILAIK